MKTFLTNKAKWIYTFFAVCVLIFGYSYSRALLSKPKPVKDVEFSQGQIFVGENVLNVAVADTFLSRERGLSGRESLGLDEGTFFVFQKPYRYGFWMKDMLFPLDIIWMDSDLVVNHIEKEVSPDTFPKNFYPESDSLYVLEISSGNADRLGIKIGDKIIFRKE
ncbi:MAG: DUF192 domain-containing protein [Candidatus Paceibacterota bacterium]